jgi:hypothetical protein
MPRAATSQPNRADGSPSASFVYSGTSTVWETPNVDRAAMVTRMLTAGGRDRACRQPPRMRSNTLVPSLTRGECTRRRIVARTPSTDPTAKVAMPQAYWWAAISGAATIGPPTRDRLPTTAWSEMALDRSPISTVLATAADCAGPSAACDMPNGRTRAKMSRVDVLPANSATVMAVANAAEAT